MKQQDDISIIISKCIKSKHTFGIRSERNPFKNGWNFTWAFKIKESAAQNEAFDKNKVGGEIQLTAEYPGCPHCGSFGFVQCGVCEKISCWNSVTSKFQCPWCGTTGEVQHSNSFNNISSGNY